MEPERTAFVAAAEELLRRARHAHGTLRLVGEPAIGDVGRGNTQDVFSVASHCLFGFLDTRDATALRATCREARDAVAAHPWADAETRISGRLASWRTCFPCAVAANVYRRRDLVDADFAAHLRGVRTLGMRECTQPGLTDAAFAHLAGLETLDMARCRQITGAVFAHLRGTIRSLDMSGCSQATFTDVHFEHLRGIRSLNVSFCTQLRDAAFAHLGGIEKLDVYHCGQITDAAFLRLGSLKVLDVSYCTRITDAAFAPLCALEKLDMIYCRQPGITDAALAHLRNLRRLVMNFCSQPTITGTCFAHLGSVRSHEMHACCQAAREAASREGLPVSVYERSFEQALP